MFDGADLGPLDGGTLGTCDGAALGLLDGTLAPMEELGFVGIVAWCSNATEGSSPNEEACSPSMTMTLPQVLQRMRRIFCLTFASAIE
jgi:hypothetical protein